MTSHKEFLLALESFDSEDLDDFETMQYQHHINSMTKVEALEILINTVEGDFSQLSVSLQEIAYNYYNQN